MSDTRKKWLFILVPVSWLYTLGVKFRNFLFDLKILSSKTFEIPVISIGNITVGGTGKTPHTEYVIQLLSNYKTAVLSRGYKRKTSGFVLSTTDSTSLDIGDEPRQIKVKFPKLPVAVDGNRRRGITKLQKEIPDLDVIVLDDGFQHRWVNPALSIVLVDYNRPVYEDAMLPAGNLREDIGGMRRAGIVIVTKTPKNIKPIDKRVITKNLDLYPYQKLFFSSLKYGKLTPLFPSKRSITHEEFTKGSFGAVALTGIATPAPFIQYLSDFCEKVEHLNYPDHYKFRKKDVEEAFHIMERLGFSKRIMITTEKDATRLMDLEDFPEEMKPFFYYVPIDIEFLEDQDDFDQTLIDMIRRFKPISKKR